MPFIPTSKLQVSGYKFLVARLSHALTRHDTSMRHDPARATAMAQMAGVSLIALVALASVALAYFKPQGLRENARIVQSRDSAQLFVTIDNELHPVLNLVSAQLIVGSAEKPRPVKNQQVQDMPRGALVGIAGAPAEVFQPRQSDSLWTACNVINRPGTAQPDVSSVVIAGDGQHLLSQDASAARIVAGPDGATWLLNGGMRRRINIADTALVLGLGLARFPSIDVISADLFNAIPAGQPISSPVIPNAGAAPAYPVAPGVVIGSVIRVPQGESASSWYVVLTEGVQQIPAVMAAVIRNNNAFGAEVAPTAAQDVVAKLPAAVPGLDTKAFSDVPLHSAPSLNQPVTCWQWIKRSGEQQATETLAFLPGLPLDDEQQRLWRHDLVSRPKVSMYAPPGSGFFVQTTGPDPRSPAKETRWWISDSGVRYGLIDEAGGKTSAAAALGLSTPTPAPWSVLAILAGGPALSKQAALVSQDTVLPAPAAAANPGGVSR